MRSMLLLAGLVLAMPVSAVSERAWSVHPGFFQPGGAGIQVLDLDGDGRQEAVVTGSSDGGFGLGAAQFLAVLGPVAGGGLEVTDLVRLPSGEAFASDIHIVDAGAGAAPVITFLVSRPTPANTRRLVTHAGASLQRVADVAVGSSFRLDAIADIDGDGMPEALGRNSASTYDSEGVAQVLDLSTATVEWSDGTRKAGFLGAGQLDGDAALEIVIGTPRYGSTDTTGYVLDGATHAVEWSYSDGFKGTPVFGNFDIHPATREFAIVEPWGRTTVFVTSPFYSPLSDFQTGEVQAITVRDVEGDFVDEIIVGEGQWGEVIAYKPTTWVPVFAHDNPEHGVSAVALGQLDADAELEVVYGAGLTSTGADLLRVFDSGSDAVQFSQIDASGPHSSALVADFDGNGTRELAWATADSDSGYAGPNLVFADAITGVELRRTNNVLQPWGDHAGLRMQAGQLDADGTLELIVGSGQYYSGKVIALDGVTMAQQWASNVGDNAAVNDMAMFSANGDAFDDVVLAIGGRAIVLNGANGAELWRSVQFSGNAPQTVATGNFDADPATEILLGNGNNLQVLDSSTRLLERSIAHGAPILDASIEGTGAACRIVLWEATRLVRRLCDTGTIETIRQYGVTALFVRALTDSQGTLVLSDGTRVMMLEGSQVVESSEAVGPSLGWQNLGSVVQSNEGVEVYTGDLVSLHRFVLAKLTVMRNGFE